MYSAVDFGTANPGILSGSDMLAGDLGVSGSLKGQPGVAQDIAGKEAVQFTFDSGNVASFSIDFNRFEAGDAARIELRDILGTLIRTETTRSATFELHDLHGVAGITVGAASGAFVIDSLSVTESFGGPSTHGPSTHGLSASLAAAFAPTPYPDFIGIAANSMMMNHMDQMLLQVA